MNMMEGTLVQIRANAVVLATGGAGRVYRYNTNGGIVTGDGMGMALSHGVPLRDMEFSNITRPACRAPGILTEGAAAAKAVFWSTRTATATCRITAWAETRWANRKINIWSWVRAIKSPRLSGTNGARATRSLRREAMWSISICAIWVRKSCLNVCRLSVNWRKPTLASIR
jgi:fumarate reductase flavoprotein subunit